MQKFMVIVLLAVLCAVMCKPLEEEIRSSEVDGKVLSIQKRFINPMFALGGFSEAGVTKMRTKREAEDVCEELTLCRLHARSRSNFFAAFQLYIVKENARQWDHHARNLADCERRFGDCYEK